MSGIEFIIGLILLLVVFIGGVLFGYFNAKHEYETNYLGVPKNRHMKL